MKKFMLFFALAIVMLAIPQAANACRFQGHVFCDSDQDGTMDFGDLPLANITVSLRINGEIKPWNIVSTDAGGYFQLFGTKGALCEVIVDAADPDLPTDAAPTTSVIYSFPNACNTTTINVADFGFFSPDCECPTYPGDYPVKTQGYWKHNTCYWADPPDNNGYQEEFDELDSARNEINGMWWYDNFGDLSDMQAACAVMQGAQGGSPCDKAKAQLLALMFNVAREYVPADASITSPDAATVGAAINQCIWWILGGNCKAAQSLAGQINEGLIFGEPVSNSSQTNEPSTLPSSPTGSSLKY